MTEGSLVRRQVSTGSSSHVWGMSACRIVIPDDERSHVQAGGAMSPCL